MKSNIYILIEKDSTYIFFLSPLLYTYKVSLFLYTIYDLASSCFFYTWDESVVSTTHVYSVYVYQDRIVITLVAPCDIIVLKYTYIDMVLFCLLISVSRPLLFTLFDSTPFLFLSLFLYIYSISFFLSVSFSLFLTSQIQNLIQNRMYVLFEYYSNVLISLFENIFGNYILKTFTNVVTLRLHCR